METCGLSLGARELPRLLGEEMTIVTRVIIGVLTLCAVAVIIAWHDAVAAPDVAVSLGWEPGSAEQPMLYHVFCATDGNYKAVTPRKVTGTSMPFTGFPDMPPFDCVVTAVFPNGESQFSAPSKPKVQCQGGTCWPLDTVPPKAPGICTAAPAPAYVVLRNPSRADGARPLNRLKDPSQPYSDTNKLVALSPLAYVAADTACDATPLVIKTTAGYWLWTTNSAGVRGIALCQLK